MEAETCPAQKPDEGDDQLVVSEGNQQQTFYPGHFQGLGQLSHL